jgi:hypothetical protein
VPSSATSEPPSQPEADKLVRKLFSAAEVTVAN